jgi:hypothetical protein
MCPNLLQKKHSFCLLSSTNPNVLHRHVMKETRLCLLCGWRFSRYTRYTSKMPVQPTSLPLTIILFHIASLFSSFLCDSADGSVQACDQFNLQLVVENNIQAHTYTVFFQFCHVWCVEQKLLGSSQKHLVFLKSNFYIGENLQSIQ